MTVRNTAIGAYILMSVIAFGHAFNAIECRRGDSTCGEARVYASALCGAVWPLYVSAVAWGGRS